VPKKRANHTDFSVRSGTQRLDAEGLRLCMAQGCECVAEYRAPRSRQELRDYIWFCLEHIRAFNQSWNYYDGIEGEELEQEIRRATTWERPTWKFGTGAAGQPSNSNFSFEDSFGLFNDDARPQSSAYDHLDPEERKAWALFDLSPDSDMTQLKKRYNELAKKYHPDHNQGSSKAEELLKEINLAYSFLRRKVLDHNSASA